MVLFKANPEKTLQRDIEAAKSGRDKLITRLGEAVAAVTERDTAAKRLALGDAADGDLERAESASRAARDRVVTLTAALAESKAQITKLECERDDLTDKTLRAETATEAEALAANLENIGREIDPLFQKVIAITERATEMQIWAAQGLGSFATTSNLQFPDAVVLVAASMRVHAARVLSGLSPAWVPKAARSPQMPVDDSSITPIQDHFTYYTPNPRGPSYRTPNAFSREKRR